MTPAWGAAPSELPVRRNSCYYSAMSPNSRRAAHRLENPYELASTPRPRRIGELACGAGAVSALALLGLGGVAHAGPGDDVDPPEQTDSAGLASAGSGGSTSGGSDGVGSGGDLFGSSTSAALDLTGSAGAFTSDLGIDTSTDTDIHMSADTGTGAVGDPSRPEPLFSGDLPTTGFLGLGGASDVPSGTGLDMDNVPSVATTPPLPDLGFLDDPEPLVLPEPADVTVQPTSLPLGDLIPAAGAPVLSEAEAVGGSSGKQVHADTGLLLAESLPVDLSDAPAGLPPAGLVTSGASSLSSAGRTVGAAEEDADTDMVAGVPIDQLWPEPVVPFGAGTAVPAIGGAGSAELGGGPFGLGKDGSSLSGGAGSGEVRGGPFRLGSGASLLSEGDSSAGAHGELFNLGLGTSTPDEDVDLFGPVGLLPGLAGRAIGRGMTRVPTTANPASARIPTSTSTSIAGRVGNGGPDPVLEPSVLPLVFALSPLSVGINGYENAAVVGMKRAAQLRAAGASEAAAAAALRPFSNVRDALTLAPRAVAVDLTLQSADLGLPSTGNADADALVQSGVSGLLGAGANSGAQWVQNRLPEIQRRNKKFYLDARTGMNVTVPTPRPMTLALPTRSLPYAVAPVAISGATMLDRTVRSNLGLCQPSAADTTNANTYCDIAFRSLAKGVGLQSAFAGDVMTDQWLLARKLNPKQALLETLPVVTTMAAQNAISELLVVDPVVDDPLFRSLRSGAQTVSDVGTGVNNVVNGPVDPTNGAAVNLVRGYANGGLALGMPIWEATTTSMDPVRAVRNVAHSVMGEPSEPLVSVAGWQEAGRRLGEAQQAVHTGLRQTPTTGLGASGVAVANTFDGIGDALLGAGTALTSSWSPEGRAAAGERFQESGASFGRARDAAGVAAGESWNVTTDLATRGRNVVLYGDVGGAAAVAPTAPAGRPWCSSTTSAPCVERGSTDPSNPNSVGVLRAGPKLPAPRAPGGRPVCSPALTTNCVSPDSWDPSNRNSVGRLVTGPATVGAGVPGNPAYEQLVREGRAGDQSAPGSPGYGRGMGQQFVGDGTGSDPDRAFTTLSNLASGYTINRAISDGVDSIVKSVARFLP